MNILKSPSLAQNGQRTQDVPGSQQPGSQGTQQPGSQGTQPEGTLPGSPGSQPGTPGLPPSPQGTQPGAAQDGEPAVVFGQAVNVTGTVQSIDRDKRTVTLKGPDGRTMKVTVPQDAPSFDRLKTGDRVDVSYYESVALALRRSEDPQPAKMEERMATAPGGTMLERRLATSAKVVSIDSAKNIITFKAADGQTRQVKVNDPALQAQLGQLKTGDTIDLMFQEAAAVSIEPSAKKR